MEEVIGALNREPLRAGQASGTDRDLIGPDPRLRRRRAASTTLVIAGIVILILGGRWVFHPSREPGIKAAGRSVEIVPGTDEHHTKGLRPVYDSAHALLIGIDYSDLSAGFPALNNAERDVQDLASGLQAIGWAADRIRTLCGKEATAAAIDSELERIEQIAGDNDQVFIYYAGHGEVHSRSDRSGWAIPADATPGSNGHTGANWLHFDRFNRVFQHCAAKHILIALDCCHSGAGARGHAGAQSYSERLLTERAHLVLASSRPNEQAWDGDNAHSPFAEAFIAALDSARTTPVTTTMLHAMVQKSLASKTFRQTSILSHRLDTSDGTSEFVFLNLQTQ